ncbi:MAG TPA: hypothetical protein VHB53_08060, partial [Solirubrobacterales bacterium]|nr:hypothetical protein [Solirubrobacterales bacterium]
VALFSIVLLLLLGLALNFSVIMSRQAAQITRLAQERAIERAREQEAREALEEQLHGDRKSHTDGRSPEAAWASLARTQGSEPGGAHYKCVTRGERPRTPRGAPTPPQAVRARR